MLESISRKGKGSFVIHTTCITICVSIGGASRWTFCTCRRGSVHHHLQSDNSLLHKHILDLLYPSTRLAVQYKLHR